MKHFNSTENLGKTAVQLFVDRMGCIFRPLDKDDVGIDAYIEVVLHLNAIPAQDKFCPAQG